MSLRGAGGELKAGGGRQPVSRRSSSSRNQNVADSNPQSAASFGGRRDSSPPQVQAELYLAGGHAQSPCYFNRWMSMLVQSDNLALTFFIGEQVCRNARNIFGQVGSSRRQRRTTFHRSRIAQRFDRVQRMWSRPCGGEFTGGSDRRLEPLGLPRQFREEHLQPLSRFVCRAVLMARIPRLAKGKNGQSRCREYRDAAST